MPRQLALPLDPVTQPEPVPKDTWAGTGPRVPYQLTIRVPALAICARNIAAADIRRKLREPNGCRKKPDPTTH